MSPARLPRFRRVPDDDSIVITDRDREILRQVQRHRFLRSSHVVSLLGGSRQPILRRLQRLFHAGYLERPRAQLEYFNRGGSNAIVHALGRKGASLLRRESGEYCRVAHWNGQRGQVGRLFLEHALLVTDFMVALQISCRRRGDIRLLTGEDLVPVDPTRRQNPCNRWGVTLPGRVRCSLIPDQVFGLEYAVNGTEEKVRTLYFLEADRGTMPVVRRSLSQSSIQRKLLAYEATHAQGIHRSRFGFNRFRVLTMTKGAARVETMLAACRGLKRGQGLFLFMDQERFAANPDLLALVWHSARAKRGERILDSRPPVGPLAEILKV